MASSLRTKLRIGISVLFATGFWDAVAGRFCFQPRASTSRPTHSPVNEGAWKVWRGALHVHSTYSDGAGDIPTVMAAARAAKVDFLLLCDHNTQRPLRDGWEEKYLDGPTLLLIGAEVTVEHGAFILALDMPPDWEPTKGQRPQVAIDEVRARGGLPLVSLPFDVKHPWRDWDATGFEGLEVVNFSTVARRHINLLSLLWLLPVYRLRGMAAVLRALVTRPDQALARWDSLTASGSRSIGIGALDAHALMKIGRKKYPIPSYQDSFRAVTTHVLVEADSSRIDARQSIYAALRAGRCYFVYDCLGDCGPVYFDAAVSGDDGIERTAAMGDRLERSDPCAPVRLTAIARPGVLLRLFHRGKVVAAGVHGSVTYTTTTPGAYRVEGSLYRGRAGALLFGVRPFFYTNPIYVS